MGLRVTVLGCSGSYAAPGGACTGYLVQTGGHNVLLDCGPGTLANLQEHLPLAALDAVVVTHAHPDHWAELSVMRTAWRWVLHRDGFPVITTDETWERLAAIAGGDVGSMFAHTAVRDGSSMRLGDQRWRFARTDHGVETLAIRADADGSSFAFSADTGPAWSLEALGAGIDLAFCESTYVDATVPDNVQHLTARQAGATAAASGVGRLVLTHQLPGEDPHAHLAEARTTYDGPLSVARVHERYET